MKSRIYNKKEHFVYSEDDFPHDVEIHPWREGKEGDWIRADDGGIIQVLKTGAYGLTRWVRTICGTTPFGSKHMSSDFGPKVSRMALSSGQKHIHWQDKAMVDYLLMDPSNPGEAWVLSHIGSTAKNPAELTKRNLKKPLVREYMSEQLQKHLGDVLSEENWADKMVKLLDKATDNDKIKEATELLRLWADTCNYGQRAEASVTFIGKRIPIIDAEELPDLPKIAEGQ